MKIKGISFFEQHVEKLVLGVAVLLFLGFAGWQVMHQPNLVDVGRDKVGPGGINDILEDKANQKQARLANDAPAAIDLIDPVSAVEIFESRITGNLGPSEQLAQVTPGLSPRLQIVEQADAEFVVPNIAGPTEVVAQGYADGLQPGVVSQYGRQAHPMGFQGVWDFEAGEPADVFFISTLGQFDMAPVLQQLESGATAEDGRALAPVPRTFYGAGLEIFGVEIQREEKTGDQWTGLTTLDPIPGQYTVLNTLPDVVDASRRDELRRDLAIERNQRMLLRPPFYATKNNSWSPPRVIEETMTADGELTEEGKRERTLRRQIPLIQADVVRLQAQVDQLNEELGEIEPPEEVPPPPGGGRGNNNNDDGPSGSGGQLGAGGSPGGMRGRRDNTGDQLRAQRDKALDELRQKQRQLDRLQNEFQALSGGRLEDDAARRAAEAEANKWLTTIWGHDITAIPGKTYRYRMRVRIYNPFFARKLNLMPSQAHLADELTLASEFSEWSNPVKVPTPLEFFVTDAAMTSGVGQLAQGPQATFEVYRFYDGVWRREQFKAGPGDQVGELKKPRRNRPNDPEIDYSTAWFVLDIVDRVGGGAMVLLQNLETGEVAPLRDPRVEEASAQRDLLELEAAQAEATARDAARAGDPAAP